MLLRAFSSTFNTKLVELLHFFKVNLYFPLFVSFEQAQTTSVFNKQQEVTDRRGGGAFV